MEEDLISKKDLLLETGISYGSLYRWKRIGLIPDGWFINMSTFTGQETFFPKEKILKRIKEITSLKENMSLEEIAETLNPNICNPKVNTDIRLIADEKTIFNYLSYFKLREPLEFEELIFLAVFKDLKKIFSDELWLLEIISKAKEVFSYYKYDLCISFIKKENKYLAVFSKEDFFIEKKAEIIKKIYLYNVSSNLKFKLKRG